MAIRVGTDDDADFFFHVEEETTIESLPPDFHGIAREELRARLLETHEILLDEEGHIFFIAFDLHTNQKMGLLWFGPRRNHITGDQEAWIYNVTVLPEHRGCGVGQKLIEHAENHAREHGFRAIGLAVATHNTGAQRLYERMSFKSHNVLMRKPLDSE
ncbi:mycothiol acetyltransferase [Abditibacteriota bacterium]|nr:mycothiol acetyltransferase [Abditibacteriota bacterium]